MPSSTSPVIKIPLNGHLFIQDRVFPINITHPHPDWIKVEIEVSAEMRPVLSFTPKDTGNRPPTPTATCICPDIFHARSCPKHPDRGIRDSEPEMPNGNGTIEAEGMKFAVSVNEGFTKITILAGGAEAEDIVLFRD